MKQRSQDEPFYTRLSQLSADIFNERHCRSDEIPTATLADAKKAQINLGLDKQPWPSREEAEHDEACIQSELNRMLVS